MNTANIKKYAPLARNAFITAVTKRANELGIYVSHIEEAIEEGQVLSVEGRSVDLKLKGARNKLIQRVESAGFTALMEFIAYTWFNRLCAIRYMELHDYLDHGLRVLSHPDNDNGEAHGSANVAGGRTTGATFEILEHAQDVAEDLGLKRDQIIELKLAGNQDELLYRTLLLGQCHALHKAMPFLFEAIDDETELLLPDNLTRTDSILRGLVNDIPEEDWEQVEIIGWLYQFYISEKKDEVIGKVVKSEDIPAATQLFTPNWIVKYLVQNSVGRQWLQTYPDSSIKAGMEYYIEPAEQTDEVNQQIKTITPDSIEPESIKVLDPACGSGHILVEAYQVLKAIYKERGFRDRDIPKLILENNLFGLDIDDRAAQLAGFALMMMAREDDRRIFTRDVQLNVMAMQSTAGFSLQNEDCLVIQDEQQRQEFVQHIQDLLALFEQARTLGSLIEVPDKVSSYLPKVEIVLKQLADSGDLFAQNSALTLIPIIKQARILARKYDAVIANPPYMGKKSMNGVLKNYGKNHFPASKLDLFTMFMERSGDLIKNYGVNAQINMQAWMFLNSYEALRIKLFSSYTCVSLAHLGTKAFSEISGEIVKTVAWIFTHKIDNYNSSFHDCTKLQEQEKANLLRGASNTRTTNKVENLAHISGWPLAYWVDHAFLKVFTENPRMEERSSAMQGLVTADNEAFVRFWHEINTSDIDFYCPSREISKLSGKKWFLYNKGGSYRKWFGNQEHVVNWECDGHDIKLRKSTDLELGKITANNSKCWNQSYYFKEAISWSGISTDRNSFRLYPTGSIFSGAGLSAFFDESVQKTALGLLNSNLYRQIISVISPGHNLTSGEFGKFPFIQQKINIHDIVNELILIHMNDWDHHEFSFGFRDNPLLITQEDSLEKALGEHQKIAEEITKKTFQLENELNEIINTSVELQNYVSSEVDLSEITLFANLAYRYSNLIFNDELSYRYSSDLISEFVSFSIGCMMGRYSLDQEGLVYAHAGNEGFTELEQQGVYKTFPADDDGIIPLTDQEWFADDATHRFREFVRVVWGEDNLQQNLDFVAESLCLYAIKAKSGESSLETIRRYLSTQFYKDHLKTYKKRPIYWLFSSGKQKAFECLVYLHRYNESTLSRMRTEYVTPLLGKYEASAMVLEKQMQDASTTAESNRFKKSLTALEKKQTELSEFDDKLKHYADMRISLDLDDGVKVNYGKFGDLLADVKAITGKK